MGQEAVASPAGQVPGAEAAVVFLRKRLLCSLQARLPVSCPPALQGPGQGGFCEPPQLLMALCVKLRWPDPSR